MTSGEYFENMWFYMKYTGKCLSVEILLTHECISLSKFLLNFIKKLIKKKCKSALKKKTQKNLNYL